MRRRTVDKPFLVLTLLLTAIGFFIFSSASLGLLAREGASFGGVALRQLSSIGLGFILLVIASRTPYPFWQKHAVAIFAVTVVGMLLVFIPHVGFSHGGATRWIDLRFMTLQPSEFAKIGFVLLFASWLVHIRTKVRTFRYGAIPLILLIGLVGLILFLQPDLGTLLVLIGTGLTMYIVAGASWSHVGILLLSGSGLLTALGMLLPYVRRRLTVFLDPSLDPLGAGYQINQSLIAIGSGQTFGRGFGQSVQKFQYLPEPIGDSIFAVFLEEWGFIGGFLLIALFIAFALRGFSIAQRAANRFGMLVATGIVSMITIQVFINMASMLGVFPLTGMPLIFVSQGGSAMLSTLLGLGIVLNISKFQRA